MMLNVLTTTTTLKYSGHLIECGKNGKLCRNFWQYYVEESDEYTEKMPDYGEILKFVGFPTKYMLTSYGEF